MYELIVGITTGILTATILCGMRVINAMLIERGHKPVYLPEEWWT